MLKEKTAECHRRVEQGLGLLESSTPARMLGALGLLHGFWAAAEPAVDAWFAAHPASADALAWTRRARLDRLTADLHLLADACGTAVPATAVAPAVFDRVDEATVLGWLYVAEGSTLGGAVIDRTLRGSGFGVPLTSFTPYPEGPGPMWRSYLAFLERWTAGSAVRTGLVTAAGVRAFDALDTWIASRAAEVAA